MRTLRRNHSEEQCPITAVIRDLVALALLCGCAKAENQDADDLVEMLLTDLPEDVLLHICLFLGYNDLVSLSASCFYLRHVLNIDIVWKRLVGGDPDVLRRLRPVPDDGPLPPPCHQRQLCLPRVRLVNNFRNQRFLKLSTPVWSLFRLEPTSTYISCSYENYFFGIYYEDEDSLRLVAKVFRFGYQEVSEVFDLRPPTANYSCSVFTTCQVVGDKLVVRQGELFSVYQNTLPLTEHFPLLHSIDVRHGPRPFNVTLVGNLVFSENYSNRTTCVWDIHSGVMLGPLSSKVKDFDLALIGHSSKLGAVLFLSRGSERSQTAFIFEYCIALKAFTDFSVSADNKKTKIVGLISDKYNTIIVFPDFPDDRVSVCVYDRIRSVLVSEREFQDIRYYQQEDEFFIFNDSLVLPSMSGLKITRLCNLEVMWEIPYFNVTTSELPELTHVEYKLLNIANALHLIVVSSFEGVSFWDCELRRKLFELPPGCDEICLNDACTKLIFLMANREQLCVWTFGEASSDQM